MVFITNNDDNKHGQTAGGFGGVETPTSTERTPIFAVVAAPLVASTSREALLEWLKLRKDYKQATRERCKDGKEDFKSVLKSVRSSFDADLLNTLCEASWGEKSELTDEFLLEKIHVITDNYQNQALPPVNELFLNELKMNMDNPDIQSRVTDYFLSCNLLIKKYGFASFFEGMKGAKKKCKMLVNSLPEALKEKVKNEIDYRSPEAQTSVLKLSKPINQQALEQAIEDRALKRGRDSNRKTTVREQQRGLKKRNVIMTGDNNNNLRSEPGKLILGKFESRSRRRTNRERKECRKMDAFTAAAPTTLADAQRQRRKTATVMPPSSAREVSVLPRGGTANLRRLAECLPIQTRSIVLEDAFLVIFCADSGADRSGMSMTVYEKFVKVCPEVEVVQLKEPLDCKGADGKPIEVKMMVNLHLRLRTAAGSVRIAKSVECLIILRQLDLLVANAVRSELDDEFDDVDEPQIGSGVELSNELLADVEKLVEKAVEKGFSMELVPELRRIATRFDIWRLKLGDDPPACVPPMKVRLRDGTKPYRCKARRYPPEVRNFLDDFNNELVRLGWVYENAESRWACPVLPVRKSGGEYRQTADYKPVNADIEAIVGVMPDLYVDLEEVKGAKFFGLCDFIKGYWQLALAEECQEWLSYVRHRKIYTPRRVPQKCTDAALFFQSAILKCLEELLHKHLLVWIDDLLLFANDAATYPSKLERLFELLDFFGFKISPKKSSLFEQEVKWCGKLINDDGVHHDPERIRELKALSYPRTAGELQQFLCATNWMRDSLVDYAQKSRPLQDALDLALSRASRRTKRVAAGIAVELTDHERSAYDSEGDVGF